MNDFDYDVMQKKSIARMARYRKRGSKSKKCTLSTDNMTRRQWEKRCGEVHTYNMNEPKTWSQFKEMPADIQREYLAYLSERYHVNSSSLGEMFGVRSETVRHYIGANELGITFKVGNSMSASQKAEWQRFLISCGQDESTYLEENFDAEDPSPDTEPCHQSDAEIENGRQCMRMKEVSMTFCGEIDASMIANSIAGIIGHGAVGEVKIMCSLEINL